VNGVAWESVLTTIAALSFAFAEGFISFYFTYTQLGVLLFGGSVTRPGDNAELDASRFGHENYYILNFNDMIAAFSTLFCCLRVSDFDVIAEGFSVVTTKNARVYFALWYIIGVLLFFNILKSYFISVFQPKAKKEEVEEGVGGRRVSATAGTGRRNSKTGNDMEPCHDAAEASDAGETPGVEIGVNPPAFRGANEHTPFDTAGAAGGIGGPHYPPDGGIGGSKYPHASAGAATEGPLTATASGGEDNSSTCGNDDENYEADEEYLPASEISMDELEVRNMSGELIIDLYDIMTSTKYVHSRREMEEDAFRATGVSYTAPPPPKKKFKFIVSLPFKVSMNLDDRETVLRRVYALSLDELKKRRKRRRHSFATEDEQA
jgi:hypothetical protein